MDPIVILGILLAAPIAALMWLRSNASLVFLSLCLGNVLVEFVGPDAATILSSASAKTYGTEPSLPYVNLILLLLPAVLTSVIMIRTVKGHAKLAFNLLPSISVGLLGVLLAVPLLSKGLTGSLTHLPLWHQLESLQTLILSLGAMFSLLSLWLQRSPGGHEAKHGKHA